MEAMRLAIQRLDTEASDLKEDVLKYRVQVTGLEIKMKEMVYAPDNDTLLTVEKGRQLIHLELEERLAVCQHTIDKLTTKDIEIQQTIDNLTTRDIERQQTIANLTTRDIERQQTIDNLTTGCIERQQTIDNLTTRDIERQQTIDNLTTRDIERQQTIDNITTRDIERQQTIDNLTTRDNEIQKIIKYLLTTDRNKEHTLTFYEEAIDFLLHQQRDMKNQYKVIKPKKRGEEKETNLFKDKDLKELSRAIGTDVDSVIQYLWSKQIITEFNKQHLMNEFKNPLMRVYQLYSSINTPKAYSALYDATIEHQLWDASDILQPEKSPHKRQEEPDCCNVSNEVSNTNNALQLSQRDMETMILLPKEEMLAISRLEDSVSDITSKMESLPMLYKDVNDLKDALLLNQATNQQGPLTDISKDRKATIGFDGQYHFSRCQNVLVDHGCGTFTNIGDEIGQLISAQPLSEEHKSFSLEVVDSGERSCIIIGVCPIDHRIDWLLGNVNGTVGYNLYYGSILSKSREISTNGGQCKKGDVAKCELDFGKRCVRLYQNGVEVGAVTDRDFKPTDFHSLHASIVFWSSDKKEVKALERGPWRL